MSNTKKKALFIGSFDPITLAHRDILLKSCDIFDDVTIAIAQNPNKTSMFSLSDRLEMIRLAVQDLENIHIDSFEGLTVDYAKQNGINVLIRGLRNSSDFEYEQQMAHYNETLLDTIKTVFFITSPEYSYISSSGVREVLKNNGDISKYTPQPVKDYIETISKS